MFKAVFEEKSNVEDVGVLVKCASDVGADADEFKAALNDGKYAKAQLDVNDYAYETQKVWAVPTFVCGEKRLDAVGGVGVTKAQLKQLLDSIS
jgi:predicted DsbA family dithiol-disulfide isomerase